MNSDDVLRTWAHLIKTNGRWLILEKRFCNSLFLGVGVE